MSILTHVFTSEAQTLEAFEMKVKQHERSCNEVVDDDVKVGVVLTNMKDETLRNHLLLQSKRLTTYAMMRSEVDELTQAREATGSGPMQVDALWKGKGKGKKGKEDYNGQG